MAPKLARRLLELQTGLLSELQMVLPTVDRWGCLSALLMALTWASLWAPLWDLRLELLSALPSALP